MYNKKCKNTFLFLMALLCLITLIVPFMQVGFFGTPSVFLKIIYYFTFVLFIICLVAIILIGVYSLFKNNYQLIALQEVLAYFALFLIVLTLIIFAPNKVAILSVGYSILALETFIMATFDDILKLIKKLPRMFRRIKNSIKEQRQAKLEQEAQRIKEEINETDNTNENTNEENVVEATFTQTSMLDDEEVKIIPPDEDLI